MFIWTILAILPGSKHDKLTFDRTTVYQCPLRSSLYSVDMHRDVLNQLDFLSLKLLEPKVVIDIIRADFILTILAVFTDLFLNARGIWSTGKNWFSVPVVCPSSQHSPHYRIYRNQIFTKYKIQIKIYIDLRRGTKILKHVLAHYPQMSWWCSPDDAALVMHGWPLGTDTCPFFGWVLWFCG